MTTTTYAVPVSRAVARELWDNFHPFHLGTGNVPDAYLVDRGKFPETARFDRVIVEFGETSSTPVSRITYNVWIAEPQETKLLAAPPSIGAVQRSRSDAGAGVGPGISQGIACIMAFALMLALGSFASD